MFCNWLTEMRDGNTNNVVYSWIDNGDGEGTASDGIWRDDETDEDVSKTGYRLPGSYEWEYAARYRGSDTINTVIGYSDPCYTKGNSASGATADYNNTSACQAVAVYCDSDPSPTGEAVVKSLGAGSANSLGLYDMSGNVWEWCFTEYNIYRVRRGSSWDEENAYPLRIGDEDTRFYADYQFNFLGFRLCRIR